MKTLIVGAGALGGIIGARFLAVGASVSLATRNAMSAEEIKASGRLCGVKLCYRARSKLPLCVRLTRELHEKLMTGVRGHQAAPGQFRKIQDWIGQPGSTIATASYIPPPLGEVDPCLAAWEKFLHESTLRPLVTIALAHYQFEAIHLFLTAMAESDVWS